MKELKITGTEGVELGIFRVNVKGADLNLEFDPPLFWPITNISLTELEEEKLTFREKAEAIIP